MDVLEVHVEGFAGPAHYEVVNPAEPVLRVPFQSKGTYQIKARSGGLECRGVSHGLVRMLSPARPAPPCRPPSQWSCFSLSPSCRRIL